MLIKIRELFVVHGYAKVKYVIIIKAVVIIYHPFFLLTVLLVARCRIESDKQTLLCSILILHRTLIQANNGTSLDDIQPDLSRLLLGV